MISSFFQWPIRIIPETILWYSIILLAFFTRSKYHERITAYQSPPPKKTRPNFMMRNPTLCMLPYHWMIFSGIILTVYCINGRSAMMSLDLQYRNAHWLIIINIKNYIFPRKSKLPPERYKKHPYIHVYNNPKKKKIRMAYHVFELISITINRQHKIRFQFRRCVPWHMRDSWGDPFQKLFSS